MLRLWHLLLASILLFGIALRIRMSFDALQVDELWSLGLTMYVHRILDVFTAIHHDNNHYLNTLWLWFLGPGQPFVLYRIPSLVSGGLLLCILSIAAARVKPVFGIILAVILSFSPLLISLSAQARGFMPMLLFGLLSVLCLQQYLRHRRWRDAALFGLCAIIAFLWQLLYACLFTALFIWATWDLLERENPRRALGHLAALFFLPALFFFILYVTNLREFTLGGMTVTLSPADALAGAVSTLFGTPAHGLIGAVIALIITAIVLLWTLRQEGTRAAFIFTSIITMTILLVMSYFGFALLAVRYLIIPILFVAGIVSWLLAQIWERGTWGRISIVVLLLWIVFSGLSAFYKSEQRINGERDAVQFLAAHSTALTATATGNHEFRLMLLLYSFNPYIRHGNPVRYVKIEKAILEPPCWFINEIFDQPEANDPIVIPRGYRLVKEIQGPDSRFALLRNDAACTSQASEEGA